LTNQLDDCHFNILGISRLSKKEEIKIAYRDLIKKWHPDKFSNFPEKIAEAEAISKKLNDAYALLKNYKPPPKAIFNSTFKKTGSTNHTTSSFKSRAHAPKATRLNILRIRVMSSNIHSVGYDKGKKVLQVEFLNGSIYQYYDVPDTIFNELLMAESKGIF
jgi:curved DNA-binding protein CbpA